ncbi:MAG TPA: PmoA family protein [Pirellulaceae bacterium]|nr:PmoA family protein [Pirellulaceae bacterium]
MRATLSLTLVLSVFFAAAILRGEEPLRALVENQQLVITRGNQPLARYVFQDETMLRPYFTAVHAPGGVEVTRRHPPREGIDADDHPTMHPGIWLAFGDLGGADFWRNKGRALHERFTTAPKVEDGVLRFAVRNRYLDRERLVCQEDAAYSLGVMDGGYLLSWDSTFTGSEPFAFGDQEEMGLGIRLATPLCVQRGSGTITTSEGKRNEKEAWGTPAKWCDYSGTIDGRRVGVLLMPHPENFRASWLHVRDYGLAVANPFGRKAFTNRAASRIEIKPGERLRLRFGVWIYDGPADKAPEFDSVRETYVSGQPD